MKNKMKYIIIGLSLLSLAACKKTQECYRCEVTYQTYMYTPQSGRDTSYVMKDDFCNVERSYVTDYVAKNSDTIALQNRKDANGNTITEHYARKVNCERYFK